MRIITRHLRQALLLIWLRMTEHHELLLPRFFNNRIYLALLIVAYTLIQQIEKSSYFF